MNSFSNRHGPAVRDWMPGGFLKKKTIKMSPELARMIQEQLAAFKERFGREAGPEDPVFFDPDADTPQLT